MNAVGALITGGGWLGFAITSTYRDLAFFFLPVFGCKLSALQLGAGEVTLDGLALVEGVGPGVESGVVNGVTGGGTTAEELSLTPASARSLLILAYGSSDGGKMAVWTFFSSLSFFLLPPNQLESHPFFLDSN